MYMGKKVFALLLTILLLFNISSVMGSIADVEDSDYAHAITVVVGLGIMDSETSTDFYPGDELVRAEAVRYIMNLRNIDAMSDSQQYFKDVPVDYYAFESINKAVALGAVSGDNEKFYPERKMTFSEAVKLILSVMNYDVLAIEKGGFPFGYLSVANGFGLLKDIKYSSEAPITKGQLAALIYNSFKVKIYEQRSFGEEVEYKQSEDETALSFLNLSVIYGIVNANSKATLYTSAQPLSKGQVRIGTECFDIGNTNADRLIGYNVESYYKDDKSSDIKELVFTVPKKGKNTKVEINVGKSDVEYSNGKLKCYEDSGTKTYDISNTAAFIYNGAAVNFSLELFKFNNGSITLLNNGNENMFNVVFINAYQNFVVDSVSVLQRKIFFKDKRYGENNFIELPENDSQAYVSILKENKIVDISELKSNNVVSIIQSKVNQKEIIELHLSSDIITGKLEEYSADEKSVTIENKTYELDNDCQMESDIKVSDNVQLYLNFDGRVVSIAAKKVWERNYAFVLAASEGTGLSDAQARLVDVDGIIATYAISENATVNGLTADGFGEKYSAAAIAQMMRLMDPQLITIELDAQKRIKNIDLASGPSGNVLSDKAKFTLDHSISTSKRATDNYIDGIGTATTRFFVIPPKEGDVYSEEDCSVKTNYLTVGRYYDKIKFYDIGQNGVAQAALIMESDSLFFQQHQHEFFVVEKTAKVFDEDGEILTKVYGKAKGVNEELIISPKASDAAWIRPYDIENISFGDILVYEKDNKGRVGVYAVLYVDSIDKETQSLGYSVGNGFDSGRDMQVFIGTVKFKDDKYITVSHSASNFSFTVSPLYLNQTPDKYIVYIVNRLTGKIRVGNISDLTATNYNTAIWGDKIIARGNKYYFTEGVIFE